MQLSRVDRHQSDDDPPDFLFSVLFMSHAGDNNPGVYS